MLGEAEIMLSGDGYDEEVSLPDILWGEELGEIRGGVGVDDGFIAVEPPPKRARAVPLELTALAVSIFGAATIWICGSALFAPTPNAGMQRIVVDPDELLRRESGDFVRFDFETD